MKRKEKDLNKILVAKYINKYLIRRGFYFRIERQPSVDTIIEALTLGERYNNYSETIRRLKNHLFNNFEIFKVIGLWKKEKN